eukprot:753966-Hanusia_phi.AAC.3
MCKGTRIHHHRKISVQPEVEAAQRKFDFEGVSIYNHRVVEHYSEISQREDCIADSTWTLSRFFPLILYVNLVWSMAKKSEDPKTQR